jgi:ABC-type nitrate/sulfonate/bicarbonate transport system substrate-binding protein
MIARLIAGMAALAIGFCAGSAGAQEKVKIGYWTSGFSVGFGTVMEAGKFAEQQGLVPEYIHFADVNAPSKAILTQSIDMAFAAATTGAFTLSIQGAPIDIVLATQVAEATLVSKDGSPIKSVADLKGKKVGMSPVGSATYAIVAALLEKNFGLKPSDYTPVGGNEGQLVSFLQRGDVDAASLRAVTIASVPDLKLQVLGRVVDEWKKMTKADAPPILGSAIVHRNFTKAHPEGTVMLVRALMAATRFGATQTEKTAEMLRQASNLDAKDATSYARLWNDIYIARMEPADVATYKTMAEIFRASGTIEGRVPDSLYLTGPYERAKTAP